VNGHEAERASTSDHLALGTVAECTDGWMVIEIDHMEEVPQVGQRVTIVEGWNGVNEDGGITAVTFTEGGTTITLTTPGELGAGAYAIAERMARCLATTVNDVQGLMDT
jgi:hypothetical protein